MTAERSDQRQEWLEKLEHSAENWKAEFSEYESRMAELSSATKAEINRAVDELKVGWFEVRQRMDELRRNGEEHLDEATDWASARYRDLAALGQRVSEKVLDSSDRSERVSYYLNPAPDGGWELRRSGAAHPIEHFEDKRSALAYSARHARQHEPSQLVVRRADGTFQEIRSYGALESAEVA